jgi:hypothetical protein
MMVSMCQLKGFRPGFRSWFRPWFRRDSGGGSGEGSTLEGGVEPELSVGEQAIAVLISKWRQRFHDLSDERFAQMLTDIRGGMAIRACARGIVQEGLMAHLAPASVRVYVKGVRDAIGLVTTQAEQIEAVEKIAKEEIDPEEIEGQPAIRRLKWLTRIQSARVRKALRMEGMMGSMILPIASPEIKLMSDLIDKELEVALKTGEMKAAPQTVTLDPAETIVSNPAAAYRAALAYRRVMQQKALLLAGVGEGKPPA